MDKKIILLTTLFLLISVSSILGDQRIYVWTYEYKTMKRAEGEFEHYFTLSTPKLDKMEGQTSVEHQLELEVGMTDHFDFAIYQVLKQNPGDKLSFDSYKLRARYRFGEKDMFVVDPLIYLEYIGKPDFSKHKIEAKLILAKDFKKFNVAFNPYFEYEGYGTDWKFYPKYSLGFSYQFSKLFNLGVEFKGSEDGHYFGPTIAHGNKDFWFCFGSAIKFTEIRNNKPEFQLRLLTGIHL